MKTIPFADNLEYTAIRDRVLSNNSVLNAHTVIIDSLNDWWGKIGSRQINDLRNDDAVLYSIAEEMKTAFVIALSENGILDDFAIRGAFVEWFNLNESTLRTIVETGYPAALVEDHSVIALENQSLLDRRDRLSTQVEIINTQHELLSRINRSNNDQSDDSEEDDSEEQTDEILEQLGDYLPNFKLKPLEEDIKNVNSRIKTLVEECKAIHNLIFDSDELKSLPKGTRPGKGRTTPTRDNLHKMDELLTSISEIDSLDEIRISLIDKIAEWDILSERKNELSAIVKPHEDYKDKRTELNNSLKKLNEQIYLLAKELRKNLPLDFVISEVTNQLRLSMELQIQKRLDGNVDQLIQLIESMYERYARTLAQILQKRDSHAEDVVEIFDQLGYTGEV